MVHHLTSKSLTKGNCYLKGVGISMRNWVDLAQDMDFWRALVNATLKLQVL